MSIFIDKALKAGCSEAEVCTISKNTSGLFFSNNKISDLQAKESRGIALRIKKDKRMGFISSSNLKDVDDVVDKAVVSTAYGDDMKYRFVEPRQIKQLDLFDKDLAEKPIEDFIPRAEKFIRIIRDATNKIMVDCSFQKTILGVEIENSLGLAASYRKTLLTCYTEMRLTDKNTSFEIEMQYDRHDDSVNEEAFARKVAADIPHLVTLKPISSGKKTVIFTPSCFGDLFFALETGLRGSAAVKGVSPLKDKLGQKIFDERITILDDLTEPGGKMAAPFDDEGTAGQRTVLVENGILKNFITDLSTANELGVESTGNGLRSKGIYRVKDYSAKPVCDFSNVVFSTGSMSVADMIASVDDGVMVESIGGLLLANLTNGDYSGTIAHGLKIEHGKIVGRVTNAMISGNVYHDFLHNLIDFSKDADWLGAFSGQIGALYVPHVLLKNITISSR